MNEDGTSAEVRRLAGRSAGADARDPYANADVESLPDWWTDAIEEFEAHGLRPYRPPRFVDGTLKYEVVSGLEADLGVSIRFLGRDVNYEDDWLVEVDGQLLGEVGRHRSPEGYTVFEMDADEFAAWVREEVADG